MTSTAPSLPSRPVSLGRLFGAEAGGTFLLVFGLVGAAVFTTSSTIGTTLQPGIGLLGPALALGLAVLVGASVFGPVSGGHFNPAVTLASALAGRTSWAVLPVYVVGQLIGAICAAGVLAIILAGQPGLLGTAIESGLASNGYGDLSPAGFGLASVGVFEVVATALLVTVVLTTTHPTRGTKAAPFIIGASLTSMLLLGLPIDNASINPARSLATAVFAGPEWLGQVWVFFLFPLIGAAVAAVAYRALTRPRAHRATVTEAATADVAPATAGR